jgi:hypothetical protein
VNVVDETYKVYAIERTVFFAKRLSIIFAVAFSVIVLIALQLSHWMPTFTELGQSYRELFVRIRHAWSTYWQNEPRINKLALGSVLLLSCALRLLYLNQPMRPDEAATVYYAKNPDIFFTLSNYSLPNNHLLHTLLVYLSINLFGTTAEWVARLPAFLLAYWQSLWFI